MLCPIYWDFYFPASGVPVSCCGAWPGSVCKVHIALQELQAVALMLCKMAFKLSSNMVALHLDHITAKAYL